MVEMQPAQQNKMKQISPEQQKENKRVSNINKFIRIFNASKDHYLRGKMMDKITKFTDRYDAKRKEEAEAKK